MSNYIKNPYFDKPVVSNALHVVVEQAKPDAPVKEYPAHEEQGMTIAIEPGFTSIIVPAFFNSYPVFHYTGHCLGSIREHTDRKKTPYEIILVQNGGRESGQVVEEFTEETFKKTYAEKVIPNKVNVGFGKAVNQAIRCAKGEYIAIVNNDTMVFDHWLEDMQEALKAGIDLIQAQPMYGMPFARATEANRFRQEAMEKPIEESFDSFRDFSCVLTHRSVFEKVGLFNEDFFMYGEDLDLIRRIEKAQGKIASSKRVRIFHISGGTSSGIAETPEIMNESSAKLKEIWGY